MINKFADKDIELLTREKEKDQRDIRSIFHKSLKIPAEQLNAKIRY